MKRKGRKGTRMFFKKKMQAVEQYKIQNTQNIQYTPKLERKCNEKSVLCVEIAVCIL